MVSVLEAAQTQGTPLQDALDAGLENLSLDQEITFTKYVKLILPLDGFVFWVKASLVSQSALLNVDKWNQLQPNAPFRPKPSAAEAETFQVTIKGSLHYATRMEQGQEENYSINDVVFTSEAPIDAFNQVGPNVLYIAVPTDPVFEGIRYAFSLRGNLYKQAGLYHYRGAAVYADMASQIVDRVDQFMGRSLIVSNSLPVWLAMSHYQQYDFEPFGNDIPLFPSFLAPQNIRPPFGTVHIESGSTEALASAPMLGPNYEHTQLCCDRVQISFFGLNNDMAMTFVDFVMQYSTNWETIGITNVPVFRDEKRQQAELMTLAQKKTVDFHVTYLQSSVRQIARQLIEHCIVDYIPQ